MVPSLLGKFVHHHEVLVALVVEEVAGNSVQRLGKWVKVKDLHLPWKLL
jgi:hypothetical protein